MSDRYKLVLTSDVTQSLFFGGNATLTLKYVITRNGDPFYRGSDEWADQSPENLDMMRGLLRDMLAAMGEKANLASMRYDEMVDIEGAWISFLVQLNGMAKEKTKKKEKERGNKHGQ